MNSADVIDAAAGLVPGDPLHRARRFRTKVVDATQASHDAILLQPVVGLSVADRLRVAVQVCELAHAPALAQHYRQGLASAASAASAATAADAQQSPSPALPAMLDFALALTTDPRHGDARAVATLKAAGLGDAAIVALAQLVAFLSYQTRVVAGLSAMRRSPGAAA